MRRTTDGRFGLEAMSCMKKRRQGMQNEIQVARTCAVNGHAYASSVGNDVMLPRALGHVCPRLQAIRRGIQFTTSSQH